MTTYVTLITFGLFLILFSAGVLTYLGLQRWLGQRQKPDNLGWRKAATLAALLSVSLAVLLFLGYAVHNIAIGGDRNGTRTTLLCIRTGNYLSLAAVILGTLGKGKGRWPAVVSGAFLLMLWLGQGMSL